MIRRQLFRVSANALSRGSIIAALLGVLGLGASAFGILFSPYYTHVGLAIEQPVPFSHRHHVGGLGIDCLYCHKSVETSGFAGLPTTEACMTCHREIWTSAAMLEPVRKSWATGKPISWTRVHDLPDFVYFNHSIHIAKGVGCVTCHGQVDNMALMAKDQTLFMRWCLQCHREPEKNLRPPSEVFNLHWQPRDGDQLAQGIELKEKAHVGTTQEITSCSTCHR